MERQDYIDQINSLKEALEQFRESNSFLRRSMKSLTKQNEALQCTISHLSQEIGLLRAEVSKQTDYNKRHNKMSFGKKCLSSSTKQEEKKSREEGVGMWLPHILP